MDDQTDIHRMDAALKANARHLESDLEWFARVLDARLNAYFATSTTSSGTAELSPPDLNGVDSAYSRFLHENNVDQAVRLVILLALIPHVRPQLLDVLWTRNDAIQRGFTEFGGIQAPNQAAFLPTGETAAFLLGGDELAARFRAASLFDSSQFLSRHNVLHLSPVNATESPLNGVLTLSREFLHRCTTGVDLKPAFNTEFPARLISTKLEWSDLVLPERTLVELEEIRHWVLHGTTLLRDWGMGNRLPPGFTSLFHGPPGTGKTLAACLLGKHCGCDVYRVDLSMIVSKYIGETEKNLAKIFDAAEHKRWILFFDEADALFGKRTRVDDAHDRFANQEISFLLQRIEDFDGVAILGSNFKTNIDDAFLRRFQSIVHFLMPRPPERLRIWTEAFPKRVSLESRVDLPRIAEKYELSGGTIMNVVRYASLLALSRSDHTILGDDLEEGIRRELLKEGRAP